MKALLHQFIDWLEMAHCEGRPCGSPFEGAVPDDGLIWAQAGLDLAISTARPLVLLTRGATPEATIANLVLRRAAIKIESVYACALNEGDFARLTRVVGEMAKVDVLFEQTWPPAVGAATKHLSHSRLVVAC